MSRPLNLQLRVMIGALSILTGMSTLAYGEDDTLDLDLSVLVKTKVTSLSRTEQNAFSVPAAVYVITEAEIRESPARTIPDLLRQVPGLHVAQTSSGQYAISARGSNDVFANKLLVLIDGQSMYDSTFAGTVWEAIVTPLNDIERIEVIRGPGASAWGANAVNGVVNIITKSSRDTHGSYIQAGGGTFEKSFGVVREGGLLNETTSWRTSLVWDDRNSTIKTSDGKKSVDDFSRGSFEFRVDSGKDRRNNYQQLIRATKVNVSLPVVEIDREKPDVQRSFEDGGYGTIATILGRLDTEHSSTQSTRFQWYVENYQVRQFSFLDERRNMIDLDVQHTQGDDATGRVVGGLHYRLFGDSIASLNPSFNPRSTTMSLVDGFIQHQSLYFSGLISSLVGTKVEYNDYTGFEIQPTARLGLSPAKSHFFWAGVSRAVRTPSRSTTAAEFSTGLVELPGITERTQVLFRGTQDLHAETSISSELGYRFEPSSTLSLDATVFHSTLDETLYQEVDLGNISLSPDGRYYRLPVTAVNEGTVRSRGFEVSTVWKPSHFLELKGGYTYLTQGSAYPKGFLDTLPNSNANSSPMHQMTFRVLTRLSPSLSSISLLRAVGKVPLYGISGYAGFDQRFEYTLSSNTSLAIVGRNLLTSRHVEYQNPFYQEQRLAIPRSMHGEITFRF
jgi:iron complex outermembrane recepter protein